MPIAPIPPIGAAGAAPAIGAAAPRPPAPGFGDAVARGLEQVSDLDRGSDALSQAMATGEPVQLHDVMVANTKASLGVDLLVQTRNRAVEAYQEIMRMQV